MITICQFGAGRIGSIHAANVAAHPDARLRYVVDVNPEAAHKLAQAHGAEVTDLQRGLADPQVDGVIIASSTDTHAELILASARAGKAIFCEKPIHLTIERVDECLREVERSGVLLTVGFNRRFDPNFSALHRGLREGRVGRLEMINITSRDPAPPPIDYITTSGGLFRDMMIHDFDMARWLLGEDPVEVHAMASCLVDPQIGRAGDVDTAMVMLRTESGALCHIDNSRRAVYGYDQRIEVFGSEGMLRVANVKPTTVEWWSADALRVDTPYYSFLERYASAYKIELNHFIDVIGGRAQPAVSGEDGRKALLLADAAVQSFQSRRPVRL